MWVDILELFHVFPVVVSHCQTVTLDANGYQIYCFTLKNVPMSSRFSLSIILSVADQLWNYNILSDSPCLYDLHRRKQQQASHPECDIRFQP